jgi:hypothetical protein
VTQIRQQLRCSVERYAAALDVSPDLLESGVPLPDVEVARRSGEAPLEWLARYQLEGSVPESISGVLDFLTYIHRYGDEVERIIEANRSPHSHGQQGSVGGQ